MKQYIAMTLGPISRVISFAEKTKELWAASYLFSYLAKQLIQPFRQRKFLLPFLTPEMDRPAVTQGAGVYPDRYIFESCKDDFDKLCKQTDLVLGELATRIAGEINEHNMLVESYLRRTIKICFFEQSFNETTEDVVAVCEQRLSFLECQDVYPLVEQQNYLQRFFSEVNRSFLVEDGFGKERKGRLFETVLECASGTERKDDASGLHPYQKYIAFVKADGDHMTRTIQHLKRQGKDVHALSESLFHFSTNAIQYIRQYGGQVLFVGGDDLLFFAPVKRAQQNIFDLIAELDNLFEQSLHNALSGIEAPSLSYGVSMTYHKFPLSEAVQQADSLLKKAKSVQTKNRIAWSLRKHSGQMIDGVIEKREKGLYKQFGDLLALVQQPQAADEFLHSFTYWLETHQQHLAYLLSSPKESAEHMLWNCLANNFNEDIHIGKDSFKKQLVDYLIACHKSLPEGPEQAIRSLASILRLIGFLMSK